MLTMHRSTRVAVCCCAAVLAGCAKKDEAVTDSTTMMSSSTTSTMASTTTPAAPTPINLADVAGKWDMRSVPTSGSDTSSTTYVLAATGTTSGWTITFPKRKPMAVTVSTDADSIMIDAGPFSSVRRKATQVTIHSVNRLQGPDNMVGTTVAHYKVTTPDSVATLTTTGTRAK
jgi:hypothetical protein